MPLRGTFNLELADYAGDGFRTYPEYLDRDDAISDHIKLCITARINLEYHCFGKPDVYHSFCTLMRDSVILQSVEDLINHVRSVPGATFEARSAFVAMYAANIGVLRQVQYEYPDPARYGGIFANHFEWERNLRIVWKAKEENMGTPRHPSLVVAV